MLFAPGFLLITALAAHSADAIGFRETEIDQGERGHFTSAYLADHMPDTSSTYVEIPDAMHFSFMGLCKRGCRRAYREGGARQRRGLQGRRSAKSRGNSSRGGLPRERIFD